MMITVTQSDELMFTVRFDPAMTEMLRYMSGWSTPERALQSILSDAMLGPSFDHDFGDLDDDVPF